MTLKQRVEVLAGALDNALNDAISSSLQLGAQCVIDYLPNFEEYITSYGIVPGNVLSAQSTDITDYRIAAISRNGRMARLETPFHTLDISTTGSLHYATDYDPVFIPINRGINVYPSGGSTLIWGLKYPLFLYSDSEGYDTFIEEGAVIYAALYLLLKLAADAQSALSSLANPVLPSLPTPPSAPNFTFTNAAATQAVAVLVEAFMTAPVFNTGLIISPPAQIDPNITFLDPAVYTVAVGTLLDLNAALAKIVTYIETDEDVELANAKINEAQTRIQEWQVETSLTLQANIETARQQNDTARMVELNKTDAAVKQYASLMSKFAEQIRLYATTIQNAKESFDAAAVEYEADIRKKLQNAQMEIQRVIENAKMSTEVAVFNAGKTLEAQIAQFSANVNIYIAQIQGYSANVQGVLGQFTSIYGKLLQELAAREIYLKQVRIKWMEYLQLKLKMPINSPAPQGAPTQ